LIELYNGTTEKAKKLFLEGMRLDPDNKKCMFALKKAKKCEELKGNHFKIIIKLRKRKCCHEGK